jgi:hypothetical protein
MICLCQNTFYSSTADVLSGSGAGGGSSDSLCQNTFFTFSHGHTEWYWNRDGNFFVSVHVLPFRSMDLQGGPGAPSSLISSGPKRERRAARSSTRLR